MIRKGGWARLTQSIIVIASAACLRYPLGPCTFGLQHVGASMTRVYPVVSRFLDVFFAYVCDKEMVVSKLIRSVRSLGNLPTLPIAVDGKASPRGWRVSRLEAYAMARIFLRMMRLKIGANYGTESHAFFLRTWMYVRVSGVSAK